ncbi:Tn3 family transposase, partial [Escherichia coli]|nr:Tn3 family transposase [Escherichia coli]
ELRRRVHAGLNKGEARNSLARAVFFKGSVWISKIIVR